MKVRIFFHFNIVELELKINEFLLTLNGSKIRDIKFFAIGTQDVEQEICKYAMVVYDE